jgi:cell division protein FtsQ
VWHNPRLLESAARILFALAALLIVFAATQLVLRSSLFPLREITVLGTLRHTRGADIEAAARTRVTGNFFSVDLEQVRGAFERFPWVRRVDVRRVWPDALLVTLEEHVALARWGDEALVNSQGERFAASTDEPLPSFSGPPGTEAELARRYRGFVALLAPLDAPLVHVTLTPRRAWQLRLETGLRVVLGRDLPGDPVEARLARFVAAFPQTVARAQGRHEYVDLRYPNGFALRVPRSDRSAEPDRDPSG